ncbi:MAG TPA: M56 family metallopeptidase, partial [bacterium]
MTWSMIFETMSLFSGKAVAAGISFLLHSTVLAGMGLLLARLTRSQGSVVQSIILRATLTAVILCPWFSILSEATGIPTWTIYLPQPIFPSEAFTPGHVGAVETKIGSPAVGGAAEEISSGFTTAEDTVTPPSSGVVTATPQSGQTGGESSGAAHVFRQPSVIGTIYILLFLIWLTGFIYFTLRLLVSYIHLYRLRGNGVRVESPVGIQWKAIAQRHGVRGIKLRISGSVRNPCLTGIFRPIILLPPTEISQGLITEEVMTHEMAHFIRKDCFWFFLGKLTLVWGFYQPLMWILFGELQRVAEDVCDDYVMFYCGDRSQYARQLVYLAERGICESEGAVALGVILFRSSLGRRIKRILDTSHQITLQIRKKKFGLILLTGFCLMMLSGLITIRGGRAEVVETDRSEASHRPAEAGS